MTRVRVEEKGALGRLTLARPEKKNALDRQTVAELLSGLESLAARDNVRVILLTGDGADFCAGADLEALEGMIDAGRAAQLDDARALGRVFTAIRQAPVPVVAGVRGRAIAGGAGLAIACDIVCAHREATFAFPEVRIGFVPAMVMTLLRRVTTERHALDLALTGRTIDASEAAHLGLVTRVLAPDEFEAQVDALCAQIAKSPAEAVRRTKTLFHALDALAFDDAIEQGAQANADARSTAEFRSGVRAFLARTRSDR